jgi:outer membrane protein TolC
LENNASIKKARLDERSARFQKKEIIGSGLPQLKAYGNYNNFLDIYPQGIPGGLFDPDADPNQINVIAFGVPQSVRGGMELTQLVYSQSYLVGLKAAHTAEEFYHFLSLQTEDDVIYDVVMNYYNVMAAELQMESLKANYDKLSRLKTIIQSQVDNDLARKIDLNRIIVNMTTLETEMDNLEIGVEQRTNYLKILMGIPVDLPVKLAPEGLDLNSKVYQSITLDADISNRYDLKVMDKRKELNKLDIKNTMAGYYPTLAAFMDLNYNAFSNSFDFLTASHKWYRGTLLGVQLNIPVFDGFQRKNKLAQAKITSEQLEWDERVMRETANAEYLNATKKMNNSLKGLLAQKDNLELSEQVFAQTEGLYKEGMAPLTDLLDSELALREARSAYYRQAVNVKTAQADLLKSTGNIKNLIN